MINVFHKNRNTIGNLAIALLLLGGCVFILTGSWNSPETVAASSCCGGGATATTLTDTTTGGCCGSVNKVSESDTYNCNCLNTDDDDSNCNHCEDDPDDEDSECNGANTQSCADACDDVLCGESGSFCNSTDFETYCPNDGQTQADGCEGSGKTCSKRT